MIKRLEADIFFYNKTVTTVMTQPPSTDVFVIGEQAESVREILRSLETYPARVQTGELAEISARKDPAMYVAFLYQAITGSYWRAGQSRVVEREAFDSSTALKVWD